MPFGSRVDTAQQARERGDFCVARVNKGRLDVERFTDTLNQWAQAGYRLHTVFEQDGNTVTIFERMSV